VKRAVILDRDGTLIDFYRDVELGVVTPAFHPDQVRLLPGVLKGLRTLRDAGYALSIATNQPDAAKGKVPRDAIERTNRRLLEALDEAGIDIASFHACMHHPEGGPGGDSELIRACDCRKPKPGLLDAAMDALGVQKAQCWMIGDTAADAGAAKAAGLRFALLLQTSRCELCQFAGATPQGVEATLRAPTLDQLASAIVASG
jgi:D-glycero-D-manno-heptose 1,7-bisphosphate phosphatase